MPRIDPLADLTPAPPRPLLAAPLGRVFFFGLLALGQTLLWWAYYADGAKTLIGDEQMYQTVAIDILGGGAWHANTIWPPLQSLFIAGIYWIFGPHLLAVQIGQSLMLLACALLVHAIWRRVSGNETAARIAAALFVLNPSTAAYAQWLWPEVLHLLLTLLVLWLLLVCRPSKGGAFLAGLCTGLALLAKSLLSLFWPFLLYAFAQTRKPYLRIVAALLFVGGVALPTVPTMIDGWRQWGSATIADSSMYNLWVGLTDRWRSDYVEDMGGVTLPAFLASGTTPAQRNAVYGEKVRDLIAERGLVDVAKAQLGRQYFRLLNAKTPLLSQLPGPGCAGYLGAYHASPDVTHGLTWLANFFHVLTLVGCAFGIALWRRRPDVALVLLALFAGYQLALMLPLHVKARFLFPLLPVLCGFAGSFLAALQARYASNSPSGNSGLVWTPVRVLVGSAFAALLLVLAFMGPTLDHLCAA
ncbi:MAG: glycosyltransferase family 39 protein [Dokdonella sp.]